MEIGAYCQSTIATPWDPDSSTNRNVQEISQQQQQLEERRIQANSIRGSTGILDRLSGSFFFFFRLGRLAGFGGKNFLTLGFS